MLTLRYSPASPYARKVRIAADLLGLSDRIDIVAADAADEIEQEIARARRRLDAAGHAALHEHLIYLSNNKDRMRYVALRAAGLPIGSGTTESGCNTLLNLRVKRNAEHWSVEGLQGVLTLRGIHESLRFEAFWKYFTRRYWSKVDAHALAA